MFDIGWQELFVIAVVTVIVIGPKELPRVLRSVSLWVRKIKDMARDFQDGIQELAREAELDDIRKEIEAGKFEIDKEIEASKREIDVDLEKTVDPTGEIGGSIREIGDAVTGEGRDESKKAPMDAEARAGIAKDDTGEGDAPREAPAKDGAGR